MRGKGEYQPRFPDRETVPQFSVVCADGSASAGIVS